MNLWLRTFHNWLCVVCCLRSNTNAHTSSHYGLLSLWTDGFQEYSYPAWQLGVARIAGKLLVEGPSFFWAVPHIICFQSICRIEKFEVHAINMNHYTNKLWRREYPQKLYKSLYIVIRHDSCVCWLNGKGHVLLIFSGMPISPEKRRIWSPR